MPYLEPLSWMDLNSYRKTKREIAPSPRERERAVSAFVRCFWTAAGKLVERGLYHLDLMQNATNNILVQCEHEGDGYCISDMKIIDYGVSKLGHAQDVEDMCNYYNLVLKNLVESVFDVYLIA
jgi:hypothetical protein